jgi:hypothetical protein
MLIDRQPVLRPSIWGYAGVRKLHRAYIGLE